MSQSLYRKYRPQTFSDLVGQDHIKKTIENAIAEDSLSHAYLFCGPRGTGKTTVARLLAKSLLCEKGPTVEPDGTCEQCLEIAQGTHPDVHELDAASRTGVDAVREEIIGRVQFAPTRGTYKIYIIDEVHMLSTAAFNALLKTLEEPPSHVVFVLCTTHPHKVPDTIQSRCQRFDFHRIPEQKIADNLRMISEGEGFTIEKQALSLIAQHATGGMRDAITTLEQLAAFTGGSITVSDVEELVGEVDEEKIFALSKAIALRDTKACFESAAELADAGVDLVQFVKDFTAHIRDLYIVALTGGVEGLVDADSKRATRLKALVDGYADNDRLAHALEVLGDLSQQLKDATDPRLRLEVSLVRLSRPSSDLTLEALSQRISALEAGGVVQSGHVAEGGFEATRGLTSTAVLREEPSAVVEEVVAEDVPEVEAVREVATPLEAAGSQHVPEPPEATEPQVMEDVAPAEAEAPAKGGLIDLAAARRGWTAALGEMKRRKPSRAAMFSIATIDIAPDGALLIVFPAEQSFSATQINEKPEYRSFVGEVLNEVFDLNVVFRAITGDEKTVVPSYPLPQMSPEEIEAIDDTYVDEPQDIEPGPTSASTAAQGIPSNEPAPELDAVAESSTSVPVDTSLESMLAAGFGEGIVIEEVEEITPSTEDAAEEDTPEDREDTIS